MKIAPTFRQFLFQDGYLYTVGRVEFVYIDESRTMIHLGGGEVGIPQTVSVPVSQFHTN